MNARVAHNRAVQDVGGMIASATNLALSVELYLKALRIAIGSTVPSTHDLERLFNDLPGSLRQSIVARYDGLRAQRPARTGDFDPLERLELHISVGPFREEELPEGQRATPPPSDNSLRAILERSRNAFETWRYMYERGDPGAARVFLYECTNLNIAAEAIREHAIAILTPRTAAPETPPDGSHN